MRRRCPFVSPPPIRVRLLLAVVAMLASWAPLPAAAKLVVMHGYADYTSALLWLQPDAAGPITVAWQPAGDIERRIELVAAAADDHVVVARLTGLRPGATATYRVQAGADAATGTVRAQPHWSKATDAPEFTIAIGSCFFLADADPLWPGGDYGGGFGIFDAIAAKKPDLMLWLGDNLYFQPPDIFDPASMAARYRRQRGFAPLQSLLTAAPQLAIWDDHDYGPNDSDASYTMKGESLALFRRYWANPSWGLPEVPGTFGVARHGDVLLFLLDDRYYRSPNKWPDGPDKTMFGARQLEWLKQALVSAPKSMLKLVVGGSQFWNRASRYEGWYQFATEQKAFAAWLVAQKIEGVVFLSGDRHFSELLKIERPDAYPLYEFTSSPLTSAPWENPDKRERDNPDVVPGTLVGKRQFGLIRVAGPDNDRRLSLESYDTAGALLWKHEVRARDLRFPTKR
jgi:alkaline phosphatase D